MSTEEKITETELVVEEVDAESDENWIQPAICIHRVTTVGETTESINLDIRNVGDFPTTGDLAVLLETALHALCGRNLDADERGYVRQVVLQARAQKAAADKARGCVLCGSIGPALNLASDVPDLEEHEGVYKTLRTNALVCSNTRACRDRREYAIDLYVEKESPQQGMDYLSAPGLGTFAAIRSQGGTFGLVLDGVPGEIQVGPFPDAQAGDRVQARFRARIHGQEDPAGDAEDTRQSPAQAGGDTTHGGK